MFGTLKVHHIHEMIVTANRTCVLFAGEDMITQMIDAHLAGAKRATVSVGKHLGDVRSQTPAEKSLPNVRWDELQTFAEKVPTENQEGSSSGASA